MKIKNILLIIVLLFLCLGCVKIKSKNEKENDYLRPSAEQAPIASGRPTFAWIESELPNQYQIRINRSGDANVVIQTEIGVDDSASSEFLFFQDEFVLGNNLKSGSSYRFQLGKMTDSGFLLLSEFTAQAPTDLVIEREWVLTESVDKEYGRIFLSKDSKIKVLDKNLVLRAKSLHSEGALIYAFSERDFALPEANGKNSGSVQINVQRAQGELKFDLRGQKGGAGKPGDSWSPIQAAAGNNSDGDQYIKAAEQIWVCSSIGKPPTNGTDGRKGKSGGKGGRSGDSGGLSLEVEKDEGFLYSLIDIPRTGGVGGKGGVGQLGGSPGKVLSKVVAGQPFVQLCKHAKTFSGSDGTDRKSVV